MTRSTVMKRTCQKSSQPSKVRWGWLPPNPGRVGLAPSLSHIGLLTPIGPSCTPISSRMPLFPMGCETGCLARGGQAPPPASMPAQAPSPLACGPRPAPAPLSSQLPGRAQVGSCRHGPGLLAPRSPAHNQLFVAALASPPPWWSVSGAPVENGRLCRHSGAGGRVSTH